MRASRPIAVASILVAASVVACAQSPSSDGAPVPDADGVVDAAHDDAIDSTAPRPDVGDARDALLDVRVDADADVADGAPRAPAPDGWKDRRAIGQLFLAPVGGGGAFKEGYAPTNPRGWFAARDVDVTSVTGLAAFQKRLLAQADSSITVLHTIDAQGMITWDLEGEEYPQDATYIGDPRQVPTMAPELESVIDDAASPYHGMKLVDAYFKKFRDAGLAVGVTLRPQELLFDDAASCNHPGDLRHTCQPFLTDLAKTSKLVADKIAYAKARWGVTIFYVDSNVLADQFWKCAPSDPDQNPATCAEPELLSGARSRLGGNSLPASLFGAIVDANPDVLVIPEHHDDAYFARTAPLYQLFQDFVAPDGGLVPAHTPDAVRSKDALAFSAIIINNAGLTDGSARYHELVDGVKRGDVLIARAWFDDEPDLGLLKKIYADAAK